MDSVSLDGAEDEECPVASFYGNCLVPMSLLHWVTGQASANHVKDVACGCVKVVVARRGVGNLLTVCSADTSLRKPVGVVVGLWEGWRLWWRSFFDVVVEGPVEPLVCGDPLVDFCPDGVGGGVWCPVVGSFEDFVAL